MSICVIINKVSKKQTKTKHCFKQKTEGKKKMKTCLPEIKEKYKNFTPREKKVADYVLKNYDSAVILTTSELALRAGVVKSVIVRFCQKMGFSGYTEFRLALSRESARNEQFNFTPYIDIDDNETEIMKKIFAANVKTLHDTAENINHEMLKKAVEAFYKADKIYIYGIGTSAGIVCDFQYRLMQLGFTAFGFTDIANMKVSTMNICKNDAVIGISNSGRTIATIESLKLAVERGAATVCLTSYPNSEIVQACEYPLVIKTDEIQYPIEAISARIAHISILDSIIIALSVKNYETSVQRYAKTRDLIDTVRY